MLYPQNGDRIVTIDSVTSIHPMYNWHSAGSLGLPVPRLNYKYISSNKIYGSNFIKKHSETVIIKIGKMLTAFKKIFFLFYLL